MILKARKEEGDQYEGQVHLITERGISGNVLILEKHFKSNFLYEIMAKDVITLFSRCLTLQLISCQSLGCSEGLLGVLTSASCPGKNWCSEQRGPDHKPSLGSSHTHSTYRVLGMKINFSEQLSCTFVTRVSSEPK